MKKTVLVAAALISACACFAQDTPEGLSSRRTEELRQYLTEYKDDLQKAEKHDEELYEIEETSKIFSSVLDAPDMPRMLCAYNFLILSASPESWGELRKAEDTARLYRKILSHPNPIVRLYGLTAMQEMKARLQKKQKSQSGDDGALLQEIIAMVEEGYSPSAQDKNLLKQYAECYSYIGPVLSKEKEGAIDMQELLAVFENADPSVQFYVTFRLAWAAMLSDDTKFNDILLQLGDKGDFYLKALAAVATMDGARVQALVKNTANPDELLFVTVFLHSRNEWLPPDDWPEKTKLDGFLKSASPFTRGRLLVLIKRMVEETE